MRKDRPDFSLYTVGVRRTCIKSVLGARENSEVLTFIWYFCNWNKHYSKCTLYYWVSVWNHWRKTLHSLFYEPLMSLLYWLKVVNKEIYLLIIIKSRSRKQWKFTGQPVIIKDTEEDYQQQRSEKLTWELASLLMPRRHRNTCSRLRRKPHASHFKFWNLSSFKLLQWCCFGSTFIWDNRNRVNYFLISLKINLA